MKLIASARVMLGLVIVYAQIMPYGNSSIPLMLLGGFPLHVSEEELSKGPLTRGSIILLTVANDKRQWRRGWFRV